MLTLYFNRLNISQDQKIERLNRMYCQIMLYQNQEMLWRLYTSPLWFVFKQSKYLTRCIDWDNSDQAQHLITDQLELNYVKYTTVHFARWHALIQAWPDSFPAPLLIKGSDYEYSLLSDVAHRFACDWDILIPQPWYQELSQLWHTTFKSADPPKSARFSDESPYNQGFYIQQLLIEVHRDPAPRYVCDLAGSKIWQRAHTHTHPHHNSFEFKIPSDADRMLIWLANYIKSVHLLTLDDWLDFTLILYKNNELADLYHFPTYWLSDPWWNELEISQLSLVWIHCIDLWSHTYFCSDFQYAIVQSYVSQSRFSSKTSIMKTQQLDLIKLMIYNSVQNPVSYQIRKRLYQLCLHPYNSRPTLLIHWLSQLHSVFK